jgi:hypothetical protein
MDTEIIECPHCHTRVVPMSEGICPACRKKTQETPDSAPDNTREKAWEKYQQSHRSSADKHEIYPLRSVEQEFVGFRTRVIAHLKTNQGADHVAADRINEELLPRFDEALDQLRHDGELDSAEGDDSSGMAGYATTRKRSWQLLSEALRENDVEKLGRHFELWDESELLMLGTGTENQSLANPNPVSLVKEFQRALVTFTPHLIATPAIVIVNVLVFLAMVATGVNLFAPTA